jgi:hypothetical protein
VDLGQQTTLGDFTEEEWQAAYLEILYDDFIDEGYEPETASILAEAKLRYIRSKTPRDAHIRELLKGEQQARVSIGNQTVSNSSDRDAIITAEIITLFPEKPPPPPAIETTFRVRGLEAANKPVVRVKEHSSIIEAITLMQQHEFDHIPIMRNDYEVNGVVTLSSIVRSIHQQRKLLDDRVEEYIDSPRDKIR